MFFNFAPSAPPAFWQKNRMALWIGGQIGLMSLMMLMVCLKQIKQLSDQERVMWPLADQLVIKQQQMAVHQSKINQQSHINDKKQWLEVSEKYRYEYLWLFKFITDVMPDDLSLTHMEMDEKMVTLTGQAKQVTEIEQFLKRFNHWEKTTRKATLSNLYQSESVFNFEVSIE